MSSDETMGDIASYFNKSKSYLDVVKKEKEHIAMKRQEQRRLEREAEKQKHTATYNWTEQQVKDKFKAEIWKAAKDASDKAVKTVMACTAIILAEKFSFTPEMLQDFYGEANENVWKIMLEEADFSVDHLIEMAKNYGVAI